MRCSIFRNLLLIEPVQGMIPLLLVLLLLVLLFLFLLPIMLKLRTIMSKLIQLVRTQTRVNLSQKHPLSLRREKLKTLRLRMITLKSLNRRSSISVITVEQPVIRYKWLATQQSNDMITSGNHNQFPSSFAPFGDLLKALMFLLNLNDLNSSPSLPDQGFAKRKGSSKVWKEKGSK